MQPVAAVRRRGSQKPCPMLWFVIAAEEMTEFYLNDRFIPGSL
jgi:hypothetical protein